MKVLLVNDYGVLAGGAERITVDLRDGLRTRGHDARIFASTATPLPLRNEADDACFGTNGWPQRILQVANPSAVRRLRRLLAEFRPDIVHVRMFLTQLSPLILPLLEGIPALLHVGNQQTICPINTRILPDGSSCTLRAGLACYRQGCVSSLGLARRVLQVALWRRHHDVFRLVVANSEALASALCAHDVRVDTVIRNGTRVVSPRPPLDGAPSVAFAGRLAEQKGLDVLLQAMAIVRRDLPDARLLVVGDGPDRPRIERLIGTWSLRESVRMCGHVPRPELDALLGTAWVQVVPSRYAEPSANVIPEAMMRGTAVVGTNTGGTPEIVRHGVTGFVVPPGDAAALADRLRALLGERVLADRMGAAGREVALAELTTDRMLDRFESAYQALLA